MAYLDLHPAAPALPAAGTSGTAAGQWLRLLQTWYRRYRERQDLLRQLTSGGAVLERDLRELGTSRAQLVFEASKPFWRA